MESDAADRPRRTLFLVLFALAVALAYLVGMHEERGRQKLKHASQPPQAATGRP